MDNPYDKPKNKMRYYVNGKEVTDPKGKAKVSLTFVFVLSFFVVILIAALAFVTNEAINPGPLTYSYKEDSHVNNVTYNITVVDRTGDQGTATSFYVVIDTGTYATSEKRTVTNFETKTSGKKTTYTFTIQITGEKWADVEGILELKMRTDSGSYEPKYNSMGGELWIAYLVIGLFVAIMTGLIIFNAKDAAKHFKEAKEELNNKIKATQNAIMTNKTITEVSGQNQPQGQEIPKTQVQTEGSSSLDIKCPYCGTINTDTASRCENCDAPLR